MTLMMFMQENFPDFKYRAYTDGSGNQMCIDGYYTYINRWTSYICTQGLPAPDENEKFATIPTIRDHPSAEVKYTAAIFKTLQIISYRLFASIHPKITFCGIVYGDWFGARQLQF